MSASTRSAALAADTAREPPSTSTHLRPTGHGPAGRHTPLPLLAGVAGLAGFLSASAVLGLILRGTLEAAYNQASADWTRLSLTQVLALAVIALASALAGASVGFAAWQVRRLFTLRRYISSQHQALTDKLTLTAPLLRFGFSERGMPYAGTGQALGEQRDRLAKTLQRARATLLLGDPGIGKSTVLRECAGNLTQRSQTFRIALGQAPLPVLISLPGYASAARDGMRLLDYAADQLRRVGSADLGRRLPGAIGRWHVILLCDDLHEVPAEQVEQVVNELCELTGPRTPLVRVAIACDLATYTSSLSRIGGLRPFNRVVVKGLSPDELATVLRRAARDSAVGLRTRPDLQQQVANGGLGTQITHPGTLTLALTLLAVGESLPPGRSRLVARYAALALKASQPDNEMRARSILVLARLAATLRARRLTLVQVKQDQTSGDALMSLFGETPNAAAPGDRSSSQCPSRSELGRIAEAALACGLLEWLPSRGAMRFGSGSVEAALAAFWLTQHDAADGQFVVDPAQPEWWEPMIVRAALERDENGLDQRSSDPWLQRAIRPTRNSEDQAPPLSAVGDGLALSLAMTLEAWVPGARTQASSPAVPLTEEAADAFRGALDAVGSAAYTAEERALFAEDFSRIERATQMDLTGHLASLACMAGVERLVRAQAATVLVTLPSPTAAEAIAVLLRDRDPVLRQALDLALPYASAEVYARLQEAVSSDDEFVRHRASELITRGGEAAEQVMSTSLVSPDPRIRAATARALGVLKPGDAREALVALLDDADLEVCVAAANALGRLGDPSVANDLASHLDSTDADLRVAIAMALGNVRAPTVVTALLVLLLDADVRVRLAAVAALGMIADERAARALRSRQHDKDPVVQAAVATALRRQTRF